MLIGNMQGDRICSKAERPSRTAELGEIPKKSGKIRRCPENLQHCGRAGQGWGRVSTGTVGCVWGLEQLGEQDLSP